MEQLIDLTSYPVNNVLNLLLKDKTTKKNIIFATDSYSKFGDMYTEKSYMTLENLKRLNIYDIQPRIFKELEQQSERTRKKAEVFTPPWICNKMNNHCDEEWFGYKDVFNITKDESWVTKKDIIKFPKEKTWKQYIDSKRLEITCGEAPYIVSRYDTTTGNIIPIKNRIGILDRKLRIVNENTSSETDWMKWTIRAFQSVYGYEFQGDNLLIARINLLMTFVDYMQDKWNRSPNETELKKITNIITWNIWQMDGLTGTIPFIKQKEEIYQITITDFINNSQNKIQKEKTESIPCKIYDWRGNKSIIFNSLKRG